MPNRCRSLCRFDSGTMGWNYFLTWILVAMHLEISTYLRLCFMGFPFWLIEFHTAFRRLLFRHFAKGCIKLFTTNWLPWVYCINSNVLMTRKELFTCLENNLELHGHILNWVCSVGVARTNTNNLVIARWMNDCIWEFVILLTNEFF